jgi:hypothetical protein
MPQNSATINLRDTLQRWLCGSNSRLRQFARESSDGGNVRQGSRRLIGNKSAGARRSNSRAADHIAPLTGTGHAPFYGEADPSYILRYVKFRFRPTN